MLTLEDLARPAGELVTRLRSATNGMEEDRTAPEELRDVAFLFQLDDEVRNGGFAQASDAMVSCDGKPLT